MTITEIQKKQQAELHTKLWAMANDLRGNMESYEFKNYILGIIFYRYLSEKTDKFMAKLLKDDGIGYEEAWMNDEYRNVLIEESLETLGFVVEPQYRFQKLIEAIKTDEFDIELLQKAINNVTESTLGAASEDDFSGLFEDMDLTSTKLGREVSTRSKLMAKILTTIDTIDFHFEDSEIDVLGDAYEYLIGQFAANAGKKAGEFYTPQQASELLTRLATVGMTDALRCGDPTCGSGSLLLRLNKHVNVRMYHGQELTSTTYNLARMNMILHGIPFQNFTIKNGDSLENPGYEDIKFDIQVANPPYSAKWSADPKFLEDERFSIYGQLAPKSKADFAFVQHMIHYMADDGRIAVLLPHGVLFRGGAEETIRRFIIEKQNYLDAVIGLPANLFFGTSIPVCVLVLKKSRPHSENKNNILFIDASKEFEAGKNQNHLRNEDIDKIVQTYINRKDVEKYAHVATLEEIKENGFNLNIPRYVNTFEEEEVIDIAEKKAQLKQIDKEIEELNKQIEAYFEELGI